MTNEFDEYFEHARLDMLPKMKDSVMSVVLLNSEPDVKLCMELGAAILYEKPLIFIATKNAVIPDVLRRIAHRIIEVDEDKINEAAKVELEEAIGEVLATHFPQRISEE